MIRRSWLFLALVLTAGCSSGSAPFDNCCPPAASDRSPPAADTSAKPAEFDLYEPVVRHLMMPLETKEAPQPWVVYVTLPYGLSVESFCKRFEGNPIPVLVFSDAALDPAGQSAYIIHICNPTAKKVRWEGPDRASILVSHHALSEPSCRCEAPYPVQVHLNGAEWVVGDQ
jgi:hypothetical protein